MAKFKFPKRLRSAEAAKKSYTPSELKRHHTALKKVAFVHRPSRPLPLESTQKLQWENLKPGTEAPKWIPESLIPIYAAGNAIGTLFTHAPEIILSGASGHGYHYPGANYIGPMTPLEKNPGAPTSQMDDLARIHDWQYNQLQEAGVNPYFTFNEADRYMLAHANLDTPEGWAIYLGIGMKQIFPDDYTTVDPIPVYQGVGENPSTLAPQEKEKWELKSIMRKDMIERMISATEQIQKMGQEEATPFISSLLDPKYRPQGGTGQQQQIRPQPRDFGNSAFLRRFFFGGLGSAGAGGAPSVTAHRNLLGALQSRSSHLPLVSGRRAPFSLSSARGNVVAAASRMNKSAKSVLHKQTMRDYKRNMYMSTTPSSIFQGGSSVPSFVRH